MPKKRPASKPHRKKAIDPGIAAGPARARKVRCDATIEALPAAARATLFVKLGGEQVADPDGGRPAEWMLKDGVKWIREKHGETISLAALSKWFKGRRAHEVVRHFVAVQTQATLAWVEEQGDQVDMRQLADLHITSALAKVLEGRVTMDEAARFLASVASIQRNTMERDKLAQRIKEFEESTAKLKAELVALKEAMKSGPKGVSGADLRRRVVDTVDRVMGLATK